MINEILWNCFKGASISFIAYFIFLAFPTSCNLKSIEAPYDIKKDIAAPSEISTKDLPGNDTNNEFDSPHKSSNCYVCLDDDPNDMIQLISCNHSAHLECVRAQLLSKWTGKRISFGYMTCGKCRIPLAHPQLSKELQIHESLKEQIGKLCYEKCREDDILESIIEELKISNISVDNKPNAPEEQVDTAVVAKCTELLACFICSTCTSPFCGGRVDCAEDAALDVSKLKCPPCAFQEPLPIIAEREKDDCMAPAENHVLMCRPHSKHIGKCFEHGYKYAIFKCDSCCSVATWDCRTNHYCDRCHDLAHYKKSFICPGKDKCPLGIGHPPNTAAVHGSGDYTGFVLGCSKCFLGCDQLEDKFQLAEDESAIEAIEYGEELFKLEL